MTDKWELDEKKYLDILRKTKGELWAYIDGLREANRWIPVTERLPEKETTDIGEEYLVVLDYPFSRVAPMSFVKGDWLTGQPFCSTRWSDKVTHWRPLPEPPDVEGE